MPLVPFNLMTDDDFKENITVIKIKREQTEKYEEYAHKMLSRSLDDEEFEELLPGEIGDVEQMGNYIIILKSLNSLVDTTLFIWEFLQQRVRKPLKDALAEIETLHRKVEECSQKIKDFNILRKSGDYAIGGVFEKDAAFAVNCANWAVHFAVRFDKTCSELKSLCKRRKRQRQKKNAKKN